MTTSVRICPCGKDAFFDQPSGQWLHHADGSSTAWCRQDLAAEIARNPGYTPRHLREPQERQSDA